MAVYFFAPYANDSDVANHFWL